jgi:YesN/AraC family two-component response regulator
VTIADYVGSCRIALAKKLLSDKRLTIISIAQQVGYNNTETFSRNFRKLEGMTPSEYRTMIDT